MDLGAPISGAAPTPAQTTHTTATTAEIDTHHAVPVQPHVPIQPAHVPTAPVEQPAPPAATPVSTTMDPTVPSSESAPTALPTNPATHPADQQKAINNAHPETIHREVEKTKAAEREIKGEKALGTIVRGVEDDRLYAMLRRFDQQITHVLHPATKLPSTEPDLRVSTLPNLPSHSDVLKTNVERVVAAVGPSSVRGAREIGRMMSWAPEERWRTGGFCVAYYICWIFGYTAAGVLSFLVAICCFPDCRRFFFPPVSSIWRDD